MPAAGSVAELRRACDAVSAVVAVTSVEVLDALLMLAPEAEVPRLRDARLLVPGERVAAAARARGWRGAVLVARSAEDDAMLAALHRVHAGNEPPRPA